MTDRSLFPGQQENEKIYLVIREHWFYLFLQLLLWSLFIAVLFGIDHYAPAYIPKITETPYVYYFNLFKNIYLLFLFLGVFMIWTMYYLNFQVITNERIVDISQESLVSHTISELTLSRIEDVTSETKGLLGTMFSFGNVYVQTAGTAERFVFANVPDPDRLEKLILDLYQQGNLKATHE